jgi:hypothetical protein
MQMRPRNYGTLNRAVARGISHAVNDAYRQKERQKRREAKYNAVNNTIKMSQVNVENDTSAIIWMTVVALGLIGLAIAIPEIMWLYLIVFILTVISIK